MRRLHRSLLAVLLACSAPAGRVAAQGQTIGELRDELGRIREAATFEAAGDYPSAERVLREVLRVNPTSLSGLLLLERVYTVQGRLAQLVPHLERLLRADPVSTMGHQMRVRTWAALDSVPRLVQAGDEWIAATPKLETPYRELALVWRQRKDLDRALAVLDRGRQRVGTPGALALELGDVFAAAGDTERAVAEWERAIGKEGQGLLLVQRRLRALPDGGASMVPPLLRALTRAPATPARQRGALQLALEAGLAPEADRIARPLLAQLPAPEREPFLADVARRADGAGLARIAYWAYEELTASAEEDTTRLLALRMRLAQLALAMGDTARATAAYGELERASARGSPQRRQAIAVRIRLSAESGELATAVSELRAFRAEFPDAPELDEVAAAVAGFLLEEGDVDAAEALLAGVRGARSALVRGRAFLRRGDIVRATGELLSAAPALRGAEGTRTIALAAALSRITPATGELLGRAAARTREDPAGAIRELVERSHGLPDAERAAVLDFAAGLADDARLAEVAEQVRRELLADIPRSDVAPAALYWLAQRAAVVPAQREEARLLLERLILEYPRSALVPQARRALDRISGRTPATRPAGSQAGEV